MLDRSPPALRCRRFPSQQLTRPRRRPHDRRRRRPHDRRRRRRPHDRRRSHQLKPALRAALHSMLGSSPPALRCRSLPNTPRHCIMQNSLGGRCPHARHRERDLKPALRAALHSMLGSSPPAVRCRCLPNTPRLCVTQNGRTIRRPHARRRSQQLKPAAVKVIKSLQGFQDLWNRQMSLRSKNRRHHHLSSRSTLLRSA